MASESQSEEVTNINVRVNDREKQRLNEIAFEQSTPGKRVHASDIVREAIRDYLDKYEERPDECAPCERGGVTVEAEEGAA